MSRSPKEIHASRNAGLAKKIFEDGTNYDWVVTICFYSAIHYVDDIAFPQDINGITCNNIDQAKFAYPQNGRHATRLRIVSDFHKSIRNKYSWLDQQSRYSRYNSYKVSKDYAEKALKYLEDIKEYWRKKNAV